MFASTGAVELAAGTAHVDFDALFPASDLEAVEHDDAAVLGFYFQLVGDYLVAGEAALGEGDACHFGVADEGPDSAAEAGDAEGGDDDSVAAESKDTIGGDGQGRGEEEQEAEEFRRHE